MCAQRELQRGKAEHSLASSLASSHALVGEGGSDGAFGSHSVQFSAGVQFSRTESALFSVHFQSLPNA